MKDRRRFRSFVLSTMAFFVLLVPLTAGAPMASSGGCDWECASGRFFDDAGLHCNNSGNNCMACTVTCDY